MTSSQRPVPVIMYHSVRACRNPAWAYSHLTLELPFFIQQLEYLKRAGYYVASLQDVIELKRGRHQLPDKSVCLTFDDGYLDNWVFVFPLLKKYGFRATIFVSPEFIQSDAGIRLNWADCWAGRCEPKDLVVDGFLSWNELRSMQDTGLVDVQSHTMTHTFYPVSDEIVDFHRPGDGYEWLAWNAQPESKPFYMTDGRLSVSLFGAPVYRFEKAVVARHIREDGSLTAHMIGYVASQGGAAFFSRPGWREHLLAVADKYRTTHSVVYRQETEEDYCRRLQYELAGSKRMIEIQLGRSVRTLCWPNGGWNDVTHMLALQAGYQATTANGSPNVFNSPDRTRVLRLGLHQVGKSSLISRLFVIYALNAHREVWPYAPLRRTLARVGATPVLKRMFYRGPYRRG